MPSKSRFLYTSPTSRRHRKIPRPERGGTQDPPGVLSPVTFAGPPPPGARTLRWPCQRQRVWALSPSATPRPALFRPGGQARAHVIHAPEYRTCNTIGAINPTRSHEKLRLRTRPPRPRNPPDSALEMALPALRDALRISLQPTHCERRPGVIAIRRADGASGPGRQFSLAHFKVRDDTSSRPRSSSTALPPQVAAQLAFSCNRPLTESVRRSWPAEGDFPEIQP